MAAGKPAQLYGGQAVIEGVMMRGRTHMAIAMRAPDGEIALHSEALGPIYSSRWARIPFLRGLVLLWDALGLGSRALTISANLQTGEDEKLEGWQLTLTMLTSFGIAIGLFFLLPAGLGQFLDDLLGLPPLASALVEGLLRLAILIGYLTIIGRLPEITRVYGYHGAEHKTIHAYEAGVPLTPREVAKFPREHPRCGTAFLLSVVVLSILVFAFLGPMPLLMRMGVRLLLIPLLASLAYEYLRITARHIGNPLVRLLVTPNLALQRLTTREPDEAMLEVGIAAFKEMKRLEDEAAAA
ncbi:MAG: DUF1385 domain-containing protein [Anaerolineales bacterium]|nr:DUF1385 domain-containing protein [Anaerolineales bacterium]